MYDIFKITTFFESNPPQQVSESSRIPLRSVGFCTIVTAVICVINIGSTVAFNAIVSLTIAGLYISYLIPIVLITIHRARGDNVNWGPWNLGKMGIFVNVFSIIFLTVSVFFSFFPPGLPVTPVSMNWSCVVFGGFVIIGLAYYATVGRKIYEGPIKEV